MKSAATRRVEPVLAWAVVVCSARSRWILVDTVARTRRKAIERFEGIEGKAARAKAWARSRTQGYACEKIIVEEWREQH